MQKDPCRLGVFGGKKNSILQFLPYPESYLTHHSGATNEGLRYKVASLNKKWATAFSDLIATVGNELCVHI